MVSSHYQAPRVNHKSNRKQTMILWEL